MTGPAAGAELSVIIISYNTRALTLTCLTTLFAQSAGIAMRVILLDNDSRDGSADAVAAAFPQVELVRNADNVGFARANNQVAARVDSPWLLLLNPDTEIHSGAIARLLAFSKAHPEAGITGGRTLFPDGSLNIASCWARLTPWSLACATFGLTLLFPRSPLFNPEAIGGWRRDSVRHVDIVVGCFLMIPTALWHELGGFDPRYFMYGEEADLCLRAARRGYRPMITPDAEIMHLVGASTSQRADKMVQVARAKATLIRDHWRPATVPLGLGLLWLWAALRRAASAAIGPLPGRGAQRARWRDLWRRRDEWLAGY